MKLQFLGGVGTVTGSKYLVSDASTRLLVDCGLFQGLKQLRLRNWTAPPLAPSTLDGVVLTHAHLDHSGYLPLLVRNGFGGPIYCTEATFDLCKLLLPDSGYLQEEDAAFLNRHRLSRHDPALPLYTRGDAEQALRRFVPQHWRKEFHVGGFTCRFTPAGHLLGAACVTLDGGGRRIVFSGDLGRPDDCIMYPPERIEQADYLLIESTYGNRRHPPGSALDRLAGIVQQTIERGGSVIVPAFAVGRAQALLHMLNLLNSAGRIPTRLPVYLDSPMATNATQLYLRFHDEHRLSVRECEAMYRSATLVTTVEQSRNLDRQQWPMVLISASGMATGGRIIHHLKAFAPEARHTILFTGFQAPGTRGAALAQGAETIRIHGMDVAVRARVEMLDGLSAHADCDDILEWLSGFVVPPRSTFIVHGEPTASDALRWRIRDRLRWECRVPEHLEAVELG